MVPLDLTSDAWTGAVKLIFEPIREDLGKMNGPVDAMLSIANDFVMLGRLRTIRKIKEYIITTARKLFALLLAAYCLCLIAVSCL